MKNIIKFLNGELAIKIGLWGMFFAGLAFTVLNGISPIGIITIIGMLLLAIDYPKKERRNR